LPRVDNFIVISYFTVCKYSLARPGTNGAFSQVLCAYVSAG